MSCRPQEHAKPGVFSKLLLCSRVDDRELYGFNELEMKHFFYRNNPKLMLWLMQIGLMQARAPCWLELA